MTLSGVVFPVGDVIVEPPCLLRKVSQGENAVQVWTGDGGTFGVASSVEASLLETRLGM